MAAAAAARRPLLLAGAIALIALLRELTREQDSIGERALTRVYTVYTCLLLVLAAFSLPDAEDDDGSGPPPLVLVAGGVQKQS